MKYSFVMHVDVNPHPTKGKQYGYYTITREADSLLEAKRQAIQEVGNWLVVAVFEGGDHVQGSAEVDIARDRERLRRHRDTSV